MGSNNNAASEGHKGDDVVFKSKDIVSKTKAGQKKEYFVKFKEKTAGQKFSEWFHKYKKKIVIITCIAIGAIVLVFAAIKIIAAITNKPQPEEEPVNWTEEISSTEDQINQYLEEMQNSDSNTPYTDTVLHFEELYEAETDPNKKFALLIAQVRYLTEKEDYVEADKLITYAYVPNLDNEQMYYFAMASYDLYYAKGDMQQAQYYSDMLDDLAGYNKGEK